MGILLEHGRSGMTTTDPTERLREWIDRLGRPTKLALLDAALAAAYQRGYGMGHADGYKEAMPAASQRGRDEADLNVLWLSHAIDAHTARWPAHEPIHDDGTCSTDCAGDIAARYRAEGDAQAVCVCGEPLHSPMHLDAQADREVGDIPGMLAETKADR